MAKFSLAYLLILFLILVNTKMTMFRFRLDYSLYRQTKQKCTTEKNIKIIIYD